MDEEAVLRQGFLHRGSRQCKDPDTAGAWDENQTCWTLDTLFNETTQGQNKKV